MKSAVSSLSEALSYMRKAEKKDPSLLEYSERLESQSIETEDILESIRDYLSSMSFSETEIEMMNQRISVIQRMKRRFGGSVEAAIEQRERFREKLEMISDSSDIISSLEKKIDLLAYHLYELTYDEVLIIDPDTPITREEYEQDNILE